MVLAVRCATADPSPPFSVIVNAANAALEISANDLRDVLLGSQREWPNHRRITMVRHDSSPVVTEVVKSVLGMSVRDYTRHLLQLEFQGQGTVAIKEMASDEAVCDFVSNAPGAIGFVPSTVLGMPVCQVRIRVLAVKHLPEKGAW